MAILGDYDFELPESSIAQAPASERAAARLLVLDRTTGRVLTPDGDERVRDLPEWLRPRDLLVVNATRVLAARLIGRKATGGTAEVLLLGPAKDSPGRGNDFRALLKCTGRAREGLHLRLGREPALRASVVAIHQRGEVTLRFEAAADPYAQGEAPLPPYIRRDAGAARSALGVADLDRYQTVYARAPGAIAAPTAGLHLTDALFARLRERGIERAEVVLHVGAGTFRPLDADALESGRLHREAFELPEPTVEAIDRTRAEGGRIVAVGTTTTRVLESCVDEEGRLHAGVGDTDLFIRPGGAPFRVVDALLTNFHLPRSSLLLLVAAFVGREPLLDAYREAVERGFRFYSYGDAMLIVPQECQRLSERAPRSEERT
ncbi:MAG: tRNA preQ1(34) S-adenosylmethionine ribosyltransferase-isomerase QueA [Deltaproteobacteria bacterium]|nr:tRNA preQ1(34) S-adenosylmethionine ribosyltransferase-isomerase QueA [Deltaproteobacteria bacterium]